MPTISDQLTHRSRAAAWFESRQAAIRAYIAPSRSAFLAGLGLGLALLILGSILSLRSISRLHATAGWVTHTIEVLRDSQSAMDGLLEIEAGCRGYLLTDNPSQLARVLRARQALPGQLQHLRAQVADNPEQQARLRPVAVNIGAELKFDRELIRLHDENPPAAVALLKTGAGTRLTALAARRMRAFQGAEQALLSQRQSALRGDLMRSWTLTGGSAAAGILFVLVAARFILRDLRRSRLAAERESNEAITLRNALLASADLAIISTTPGGLVTSFNVGAEHMLGFTAAEMLGQSPTRYHDPAELACRAAELTHELGVPVSADFAALSAKARVTNGPDENEWTCVRKDGSRLVVSLTVAAIRNLRGTPTGFLAVATDLTERRAAAADQRRLTAILEVTPDYVVMADASGRPMYLNPAGRRMIGMAVDEDVAKLNIEDTHRPEEFRRLREVGIPTAIRDGAWYGETRLRARDGREIPVSEIIMASRDSRGEVEFVATIARDITTQKNAEAALSAGRRAAEAANRAKSQFLANMSHELRTPLNAIIGFSEILEDRTFGELNAKQGRHVANILTSGRHLLQLINDILDLAKIESGKLELNVEVFAPARAIKDVLAVVRALSSKKDISLVTDLAPELPELCADLRKFKQVLYNLLSNAVKFTPAGGSVTVKAWVIPKAETHRARLRVAVSDTGIGIAPADHARIWQEFEQVDSTQARTQQGAGLGLALTKKLVGLHEGRIWLESEGVPGQGSTFIVELPLGSAASSASTAPFWRPPTPVSAALPARPGIDRPLVLVVEEDEQARTLLENYLVGGGYDVAHARTGRQAIELAASMHPFAITLEVALPDRPGWEVLNELKAQPQTRDIPVVIVSITDDTRMGAALGAVDFLVKPIRREELLAVIRRTGAARPSSVRSILIVDDDPLSVESLASAIRAEGYTVLEADNGAGGVELALTARPDLLILDLLMPQMDGFEVVRRLRAHPLTAALPILIYTSMDLTADQRTTLQSQVNGISVKPAFDALLTDLNRLVIDGVRPADAGTA